MFSSAQVPPEPDGGHLHLAHADRRKKVFTDLNACNMTMSMVQWRHRALPGSPAGVGLRSCRAYSRVAGRIAIKAQQADLKPLVVVGSVNADIMLQGEHSLFDRVISIHSPPSDAI